MNRVAIGITIFNDYENLELILEEISKLNIRNFDFHILDNGSQISNNLVMEKKYKLENVFYHRSDQNLGFGGGIKYLLTKMPNEYIGWMPGNYKVHPSELLKIEKVFEESTPPIFYKALRTSRNPVSTMKTILGNLLISIFFHARIIDSGGTPTIVHNSIKPILLLGPNDYSFEAFTLYMSRLLDWSSRRSYIKYLERAHGKSHWQNGLMSEIKLTKVILSQKPNWRNIANKFK
jgi:glycosyltransferase involved in cell wall biosynthesis